MKLKKCKYTQVEKLQLQGLAAADRTRVREEARWQGS